MRIREKHGHRRRVLIIEDHLDSVRTLANLLRTMGHEVDYAMNGYSGIALADTFEPDAVFVDLVLPDLTGWAVARALRARPALKLARLYAITGHFGQEARQRSIAVGFDDHFVKPVHPDIFERLLGDQPCG